MVATFLRHDVQRRAADLGFAETAGRRQHHFLRVVDVRDVRGYAGTVERSANTDAVDLQAAFVRASARAAEHHHLRCNLRIRRRAS